MLLDPAFAHADKLDAPAAAVRVQTVAFTPRRPAMVLSGTVQARTLSDLAFRVSGKVVDRPVEIGDHVHAGQVLSRLDPADLQLSLEAAQSEFQVAFAAASKAHADLNRYKSLGHASPAFLRSEYDSRASAVTMADARAAQFARQVALAKDQLSYGTLLADADGVITALPTQVGRVVTSGQTVATLAHAAETEVVVDVPENRLPEVKESQQVQIRLWADPDHPLAGRVREIGAQANAASRTFTVKLTALNPPPSLLALGMTATVTFTGPVDVSVAVVPATALTDQDGAPAVWVYDPLGHRASRRSVKVASYGSNGSVAIATGILPGEQIITAGTKEIDPDMRLTAWEGAIR